MKIEQRSSRERLPLKIFAPAVAVEELVDWTAAVIDVGRQSEVGGRAAGVALLVNPALAEELESGRITRDQAEALFETLHASAHNALSLMFGGGRGPQPEEGEEWGGNDA